MSNFLMTKTEFLVLLNLLGIESLPIGITSMPDVSVAEAHKIKDDFSKAGLIKYDPGHLLIDKGLEEYILPLVHAKNMFVFNYGVDNNCLFNASVYFSGKSAVVLQADNDMMRFIHFIGSSDFSFFILKFADEDELMILPSAYMSYMSFFENRITAHVCRFDRSSKLCSITETTKFLQAHEPVEKVYSASVSQYRDVLAGHLREVWSGVADS